MDSVDGKGGTYYFGRLMSGDSDSKKGYYFPSGKISVGAIGSIYCVPPYGWIKGVVQIMNTFYKYAQEQGLPLYYESGDKNYTPADMAAFQIMDPENLLNENAPTAYAVVDGHSNTIPISDIDTYTVDTYRRKSYCSIATNGRFSNKRNPII